MLVKLKLPTYVQEFIKKGKEKQKKVLSEPDPEEKDGTPMVDEKIITDALYNSVIKCQYEEENNAVFNV